MRKSMLWISALLLLTSCTGNKKEQVNAESEPTTQKESLKMPVPMGQLATDWTIASYHYGGTDNMPEDYLLVDFDLDGTAEVLLFDENRAGGPSAILFYNKENKLQNVYFCPDGYYMLGVGDPNEEGKRGFVMMYDNHMGEDRELWTYYFKVENSDYELVADDFTRVYADEDEEETEEETDQQKFSYQWISDMEGWQPLTFTEADLEAAALVTEADMNELKQCE